MLQPGLSSEMRIDKQYEGGIAFETTRVTAGQTDIRPLRVKVSNLLQPVAGVKVFASVTEKPEGEEQFRLINDIAVTGADGCADFYYYPGNHAGESRVCVYISDQESSFPEITVFRFQIVSANWVWAVVFGLLSGLALFLTGINVMSDGLKQALGNRLQNILTTSTGTRFRGTVTGVILSTVTQSSSAVSVMLISFVDSKLIPFRNSMAVTIGAALGTTITIQLIAFKVTDYAMFIIAVGFIMSFLWRNVLIKNIGHTILGTGLLFLGLYFMSDSIVPLKSYEPFYRALLTMENPLAGILAGCIITALTQSSGMFIGIVVILGGQGLISLEAAIPMLLGSNLGTSVTAVIASTGRTTDAKRVAVSHTIYRLAGIFFLIGWIGPFADLVREIPGSGLRNEHDISGQIANAHTLFYILFTFVSIPMVHWYTKATEFLYKGKQEPEYARMEARYLDTSLFNSPALALNLSRRETVRMIHLIQDMLNDILLPFLTKERSVLTNIKKLEDVINFLQKEIQQYTIQLISKQNNPEIINEGYKIIAVSKECEQIADIIATNLLPRAEKWVDGHSEFSNEGKKEIILFQNESQQILNDVLHCFEMNNKKGANQAKKSYKMIRNKALEFEKSHYQRLMEKNPLSLGSSEIHIELIGMMNAIARHASNIAKIIEDKASGNIAP